MKKQTKSSHSQFFPFSYHHICQISDVCQPFMQEKGGEKNAYLRMERSPGFKQQRRLRFASPLGPLFNVFFLPLVASLSEGERCRVSTRSDENVTAWFMPHLDPLFFSAGRSRRFFPPRVDGVLIPHQQRGRFLVKAPNFFLRVPPQTGRAQQRNRIFWLHLVRHFRKMAVFFAPSDG